MSSSGSLRSLATGAKLLKISAWSFIILSVIVLATTAYETFRDRNIIVVQATEPEAQFPIWPVFVGLTSLAWLFSILMVFVMLLAWVYRAHSNILEEKQELDHSPGWAVGSYFIPLINLIVPMRAMRELYNRSHGEIPEHAHSTVDDVSAWWTAYVIGATVLSLLIFKTVFDALTNIVFLTPAWMEFAMVSFATLVLMAAAYLLIKIVNAITFAQENANHAWKAFE